MKKSRQFWAGFTAAFRGCGRALNDRTVLKTYLWLTIAIVIVTLGLQALGIWASFGLTSGIEGGEGFVGWSLAVLRVALLVFGIAAAVIVAPLFAVFLVNLVLPALCDRVFMAALRRIAPDRAEALAPSKGLPFLTTLGNSLGRTAEYLAFTFLILLVSLIPLLGQVIGPIAQYWLTARFLGWSVLDPYFDRTLTPYASQKAYVKKHGWALLGFSLPMVFLLSIPIIGPLLFGLSQAAAATLLAEVLEADKE